MACTLGTDDARAQLDEWANLRERFRRSEAITDGVRLWFDPAATVSLRAVAAKEAACCGFLRLGVVADGALVRLEVTSDHADARPVIALLATHASGHAPG